MIRLTLVDVSKDLRDAIVRLISSYQLPLTLLDATDTITSHSTHHALPIDTSFMASGHTSSITLTEDDKGTIWAWLDDVVPPLKVSLGWHRLQQRVVGAGRKRELLLQATKAASSDIVIDATAGFGHDALILASTGATVVMLEAHPVMALLLLLEQARMRKFAHWHKLLERLIICPSHAVDFLNNLANTSFISQQVGLAKSAQDGDMTDAASLMELSHNDGQEIKTSLLKDGQLENGLSENSLACQDAFMTVRNHWYRNDVNQRIIYLDPMFPSPSTKKTAKVSKEMQWLHGQVAPPTYVEQQDLLQVAEHALRSALNETARAAEAAINSLNSSSNNSSQRDEATHSHQAKIIVKRPKDAPYLAERMPNLSWHNDAVRFDGYVVIKPTDER